MKTQQAAFERQPVVQNVEKRKGKIVLVNVFSKNRKIPVKLNSIICVSV